MTFVQHEGEYNGDLIDGIRHGSGKLIFMNGDIYEGGFHKGLREGRGTYRMKSNGGLYVGNWSRAKRHGLDFFKPPLYCNFFVRTGFGTETWPNGDKVKFYIIYILNLHAAYLRSTLEGSLMVFLRERVT